MRLKDEIAAMDRSVSALKKFGWLVGGMLVVIGAWFLWRKDSSWSGFVLAVGAVLVVLGTVAPTWLRGVHWLWMGLAVVLGRIVSPLVLGLIYYGIFTPVGLLARLRGRDFLQKRWEPESASYWQVRIKEPKIKRYDRQG
jgi:hypothetical protein